MILALSDPAWATLPGSYGHSNDIVAWLEEALTTGELSDDRLGDLVNEAAHQGDGSLAIYGVVPYLVHFSKSARTQSEGVRLLTHAGMLCADLSRATVEEPEEDRIIDSYDAARWEGARLLSPLLPELTDFNDFQYAVAAIAGFTEKWEITRLLETLERYEGKLHHPWFVKPILPHED